MKYLNKYITEKLKINNNSGKLLTVQDRFNELKNITKGELGMQEWHSKDYSLRLARGDIYTVHFNCEISENIIKRVWMMLYNAFKGKDLLDESQVNPEPLYNLKYRTLIFSIKKDEKH